MLIVSPLHGLGDGVDFAYFFATHFALQKSLSPESTSMIMERSMSRAMIFAVTKRLYLLKSVPP